MKVRSLFESARVVACDGTLIDGCGEIRFLCNALPAALHSDEGHLSNVLVVEVGHCF